MSGGEPSDLARVLVTYISDDKRVQQIIIERTSILTTRISLRRIAQIRAQHERQVKMLKRGKVEKHGRKYHAAASAHGAADLADASRKLFAAIAREHPERVKP